MNRIAIVLGPHGNLESVACDTDCRIFIVDEACKSEPVYELTAIKYVGVKYVRAAIGDNKAATIGSDGPWVETRPEIKEVKP